MRTVGKKLSFLLVLALLVSMFVPSMGAFAAELNNEEQSVSNEICNNNITIYYANGDWGFTSVDVPSPDKNKYLYALNLLLEPNQLPVGCYNEFPEGIRIDNFEIKDGIAYISINESILEEIDKNKYAIPLMQDIIGYNVFNFDKTISEIKFISKDSPSKKFSNLERKNFFETSQLQRVDQGKSLDFINIKDLANKSPEEIREIIQQAILKEKGGDSTLLYENYKVCLDPGHGGGDPGAVVGGIEEADLNLPIGLATREELEEWSGPTFDVVMTRTSDVDVSLTQRYNIANNNNVDCFVSIHCNTSSSSSTNGCTAIYPNNHDISDSNELADVIVDMVEAMTSLSRHRVPYEDDRGLAVLRGTQMPATVVECGFMTNSSDLAYLDNNWDDIGYAISSGIGLWCQITD